MTLQLRPYQTDLINRIYESWVAGSSNVLAVLPTGAGKTVLFSHIISQTRGVVFAIAHRQELICQMSMALARYGVHHSILAPQPVVKWIIHRHTRELGTHYYDPESRRTVCGVRSLWNKRDKPAVSRRIAHAELVVQDEGHHVAGGNEWCKVLNVFPATTRGLFVTATPERADGKGLGRHASGLIDDMVVGVGMRELIGARYLTDYRIFGPYTNIDLSDVKIGSTGDYTTPGMVATVRKSRIVGDVPAAYLQFAAGKIGVTFVPDIQTGEDMAAAYTGAGVPSRLVHAKTPDKERQESVDMLARGDLKQLVNVDIFGEGFDLPAIEVCSMARPTESYPLYAQQFGRALRPMDGKSHAIIIDHVGNVKRHGLPDRARQWSLDNRERRSNGKRDPDMVPVRTCRACLAVYESWEKDCPYCGWVYAPDARGTVEQVDGDLYELDPEVLKAMRGEVDRINAPAGSVGDKLRHAGAPPAAIAGAMARHRERQEAQTALRDSIALWAGYQRLAGQSDSAIMTRFYRSYGTDIMSAQTLGRKDAERLAEQVLGFL